MQLRSKLTTQAKSKHICNSHKPALKPKIAKELALPTQTKLFFKNFLTLQKIKIHRHAARQTQQTMTRKLNIDKAYNDTVDRRPAGNSGFAKKRVQWLIEHSTSHQLLCYVDSLVLRNPLLRKAANRYASFFGDSANIKLTSIE